ncbi:MAG TPA: cytochrome c oxidase subunit II [Limnochordales bacterium]
MEVDVYERRWMILSGATLAVLFLAVVVAAFGLGITLPGVAGQVRPDQLDRTPPFDRPGVRQVAPGQYEAYLIAHIWAYSPNEIRVPVGSTVRFAITSRDVIHGFRIQGTNVNAMVIPGQVSEVTHTFRQPGTYVFLCHEYCGINHHLMYGRIIVEGPGQARASQEPAPKVVNSL